MSNTYAYNADYYEAVEKALTEAKENKTAQKEVIAEEITEEVVEKTSGKDQKLQALVEDIEKLRTKSVK